MFNKIKKLGWDISDENHGNLIAKKVFKKQLGLLDDQLSNLQLSVEEGFIASGGQKAIPTAKLTEMVKGLGWIENTVDIKNTISFSDPSFNDIESFFSSHKIDHIGNQSNSDYKFALEIEWNNKDEFFDRDFVAMRGLYEARAIELGIIITRGKDFEEHILREVSKYFKNENINSLKDFSTLKSKLKTKNMKLSFPTEAQKKDIDKKFKATGDFNVACTSVFCSSKFGGTTTNWRQLQKRMERRAVGKTPLIILGIPPICVK
jgi:hypothetical protein